MTGFFFRILRDGKWQSVEIENFTEEEFVKFERDYPEKGWFVARGLISWIRDNVEVVLEIGGNRRFELGIKKEQGK